MFMLHWINLVQAFGLQIITSSGDYMVTAFPHFHDISFSFIKP